MRFLARSLTGLLLFALTLGLLGLALVLVANALRGRGDAGQMARPQEERVVTASVVILQPGAVTPVLTAFGEVRARRTLELRSRQGGTVVWVSGKLRDGLAVGAGEVLLRLDPLPATGALALAQADADEAAAIRDEAAAAVGLVRDDLAAAEAQAGLRRQSLARQEDLVGRDVGSPQAVETAELAVSAADQGVLSRRQSLAAAEAAVSQAAVAATRAGIAVAEAARALADTEIRAEFAGVVDGVTLVAGARVGANEALGRIVDPAALDVAMRLSAAQFALLLQPDGGLSGGEVTVTLAAGEASITAAGRLDRVAAAVGEGQTGRLIYVALDVAAGFRPGDFVTVTVQETPLPGAARISAMAIGSNGTVLAVGPDDRLEELPVAVLRRQGDDVIIRVGALAGREVVSERSAFLGDGIRIRPVRPGAADVAVMVALSAERRAGLVALVEADDRMPPEAKARVLEQLQAEKVPAAVIERLERRMGG